mmetsp:Transcript_40882/g.108347  ORF Transcript_40882/g.108347 Transcript_40882/m.108347 type:complete len:225 (+) Transcript_40882:832-1506(+)
MPSIQTSLRRAAHLGSWLSGAVRSGSTVGVAWRLVQVGRSSASRGSMDLGRWRDGAMWMVPRVLWQCGCRTQVSSFCSRALTWKPLTLDVQCCPSSPNTLVSHRCGMTRSRRCLISLAWTPPRPWCPRPMQLCEMPSRAWRRRCCDQPRCVSAWKLILGSKRVRGALTNPVGWCFRGVCCVGRGRVRRFRGSTFSSMLSACPRCFEPSRRNSRLRCASTWMVTP